MRNLCVLVTSLALLSACGKKKDRPERSQTEPPGLESLSPFVPAAWDLKSDWPSSALRQKELAS